MGSMLKVYNLKYKNILNSVSFELEEKKFNILIGSNGSGKTTIIKCILGLIDYQGEIIISNNIIDKNNIKDLIKNIGVFSNFNLLLDGTALFNIIYPLINLNYSEEEAKKKAYSISKKLDIEHLLFKNINELSLTEKKLVMFASSVISEPSLVIVDTTLDELDSNSKSKIITYLKKMRNSTILFVTNNEEDIMLSDKVIFIDKGKTFYEGNLNSILANDKMFQKSNCKSPFIIDLSNKLKAYDLIEDVVLNMDDIIEEIWN